MLGEPGEVRLLLSRVNQVALVQDDQVRLHQLGMVKIFLVPAAAASQKLHGSRFHQHGKGRELKLPGELLRQAVIDMLQRADAEAGNIRDHKLTAIVIIAVEPLGQLFIHITDTVVGDLRRVAAAELGKAVIGKVHPMPEVIGDHGRLRVAGGIVPRQGHHGRRLA